MKIEAGATNVSLFVYFVDDVGGTNAGEPTTGLLFSDIETGGAGSYARQGAARVDFELFTLASASAAHTDGGFILLDDTNMPGIYRLDVPDAAFATGVDMAIVQLVAASGKNTVMRPLWIELGTIQTDLDNATDGLGALKTLIDTVNTDLANGTDGLGALKTLIDTVNTDLANGTDGLGALKTLLDAIPTTAMRGTDNGALASEVTAARMATLTDWINGGRLDLLLDAIKVVTDKFAFTVANQVNANTKSINDATVVGDGNATPWDGA